MGWLMTPGATRREIIEDIIRPQAGADGTTWTVLRHTAAGNVLWTVREVRRPDGTVDRFIECYLLRRDRDGWGYKDMDESMHPYYYSCPLAYLDLAPEASAEWREEVRAFHAGKTGARAFLRSLIPGMRIRLREGLKPREVEVSIVGKTSVIGSGYRIGLKSLEGAEIIERPVCEDPRHQAPCPLPCAGECGGDA